MKPVLRYVFISFLVVTILLESYFIYLYLLSLFNQVAGLFLVRYVVPVQPVKPTHHLS